MAGSDSKFGIVLAGGGAKGAYQVGALGYLAELGIEPEMIAGASIGALNGAVISSRRPFSEGVRFLRQLWEQIGQESILRLLPTRQSLLDPAPLERLLSVAINQQEIQRGIELWITAFPSVNFTRLIHSAPIDLLAAMAGRQAHWVRAQDYARDRESLLNLLLASAAIPLAFPQREVNGQGYVDGGLGDNVPLGALAAQGCTHAIVIHLSQGTVWNRHLFPEQTVIEIRPENNLDDCDLPLLGTLAGLLDFSAQRLAELRRRGYEDARRCLTQLRQSIGPVPGQRQSHERLCEETRKLRDDQPL